jgi:hypothetical protein
MKQHNTTVKCEKSQATRAYINKSNKYSKSEANSLKKKFQYQLASKTLLKEALQKTKDNHKSFDDCKSNGAQTKR